VKRKETGRLGEQLAKTFLQRKGYRIMETNCRCGRDEIDIVARQKDYLVFIEVRTKSNTEYGSPEESLTFDKMKHMERAAMQYLQSHNMESDPWRVDLVAVDLDANSKALRIELVENALEF
jgi:putative endonuclease